MRHSDHVSPQSTLDTFLEVTCNPPSSLGAGAGVSTLRHECPLYCPHSAKHWHDERRGRAGQRRRSRLRGWRIAKHRQRRENKKYANLTDTATVSAAGPPRRKEEWIKIARDKGPGPEIEMFSVLDLPRNGNNYPVISLLPARVFGHNPGSARNYSQSRKNVGETWTNSRIKSLLAPGHQVQMMRGEQSSMNAFVFSWHFSCCIVDILCFVLEGKYFARSKPSNNLICCFKTLLMIIIK